MSEALFQDTAKTDSRGRSVGDSEQVAEPSPKAPPASAVANGAPIGPEKVSSRYRQIARRMAVSDAAAVLTAFVVSYFVRFDSSALPVEYLALTLLAPFLWIGIFHAHRLYSPEHLSAWEEFRRIISSTALGVVVLIMASYWTKGDLSRFWIGAGWFLALLLLLVTRRVWRWEISRRRTDGRLAYRTLIVGSNAEAAHLSQMLTPALGFIPVGYVGPQVSVAASDRLPVIGKLEELRRAIQSLSVECLFVASSAVSSDEMRQIIRVARQSGAELRMSANLPETLSSRLSVQPYGDVMALSLSPVSLSGSQVVLKRAFDLLVGGAALLILSPVLLVVATAVRLTSRGHIFFRQQRVTKDGRTFTMLKFRTMVKQADQILAEMNEDPASPFFKLRDSDPRLTKIGRTIRRFSLDELPQLFNVLRGEMSLVGPRPLPTEQVAANLDLLEARHQVPAGVTGWWQIQGRSGVAPEEAVRMDLFYIENWSLALDLFVLLKTIGVVLSRKGAY